MQVDFPLNLDVLDSTDQAATRIRKILSPVDGRFVVVSGATASWEYARALISMAGVTPLDWVRLEDFSVNNVYYVERAMRQLQPALIFAIGGGRVSDFSKRLAYIANIPLVLTPTIIANDGLISPIAVLQDDGKSVSLPGKMPDEVIIDMSIINQAPEQYLKAAACDLISNLSATNDLGHASKGESVRMHHLALQFARMAAYKVLDCRDWDTHAAAFQRSIVYGQVLSGIAMALAGSSRPCSGSEHLISHTLDLMGLGMDVLHGEKVGITSRFCLHLQQEHSALIDSFFNHFAVPRAFPDCAGLDSLAMAEIFRLARTVRPGRRTILDCYSDAELAEAYRYYVEPEQGKRS